MILLSRRSGIAVDERVAVLPDHREVLAYAQPVKLGGDTRHRLSTGHLLR